MTLICLRNVQRCGYVLVPNLTLRGAVVVVLQFGSPKSAAPATPKAGGPEPLAESTPKKTVAGESSPKSVSAESSPKSVSAESSPKKIVAGTRSPVRSQYVKQTTRITTVTRKSPPKTPTPTSSPPREQASSSSPPHEQYHDAPQEHEHHDQHHE